MTKTPIDPDSLDPVRRAIFDAIIKKGTNNAEVSRQMGKNHAYMQQYISRHIPRVLPETLRRQLADILDLTEQQLGAPTSSKKSTRPQSFDPDADNDYLRGDDIDERDHIDPDAPPSRHDFPEDAIAESAPRGGMGPGESLDLVYRREGDQITTIDAIKDDYWRLPAYYLRDKLGARPSNLLVIECKGDSMFPTLVTGDRVVVNLNLNRPADGLFAIRSRYNEIEVKRLSIPRSGEPRAIIISDNPKQPAEEIGLHEMHIVGRVMAVIKLI